ncbi:ATP-dependent helicase/nuclease subunit A [Cerasibacillus quisquiliarum]|uniref:ATP-dependent helicase/nuclease subunit A n=1 Tax=Cerasibacillus quisquiliarum TaxID=227865 RepID=A0A511UZ10_9BACI|nr:helicase-exonuclease AddAB subunit AddA [Cerasibacillus quisquiliarum]MBB5146376.1 ATP-dependent helicase/nuclease subunit A [Cerasibacillus quisquiliarum]GEN30703.1 ATP-dependent helicase/nuclease subunit A [Cerasibacillus quisquiliarum]
MVTWTTEQEQAIYTSGKDILVAAAAGSGKTAVLVERIIQKILRQDDPIDIDSLLVVTFTNAAAQEMRNRVGQALEEALSKHPTSHHLKRQLSLLQRASISTLHSFCLDIVKRHAYLLDLDPAFRIVDDVEADLMQQEALESLFEEWYGKEGEEQERFFAVVDRFSNDRSDKEVEELILNLYQFAIQNPWPEAWLHQLSDVYDIPDEWTEHDLTWLKMIKQAVSEQFQAIEQEINMAFEIAQESDGPYTYIETLEQDKLMLEEAKSLLTSWETLQPYMQSSKFKPLSRKRLECNEDKKEMVKAIRNRYKDRWTDMIDDYFLRDLASHIKDMKDLAPVVKQLTELVIDFKHRFTQLKKEKGVVDFSDLEHYCLALLVDESSTPSNILPSNVAKKLQEQFSEVLVDEYQDTNYVQEMILRLVSEQEGPGNRFMVGDVKQSIYRFRHAEPTLFIEKYNTFNKEEHPAERIDLAKNFRSRKDILLATNYIFKQILDETLGEMNYTKDAELVYGNTQYDDFPFQEAKPELIIIDREKSDVQSENEDEESYLDLEKAQLEARIYAKKIKQWIKKPLQVFDKERQAQRDIQYRDIVILLRSLTWAPVIVDELKKQGIPVYAELSTGYFEAIEVKVMISLLKAIDNPQQDIALASVLRSPIVQLNEDEMTRIRLADKKSTYYHALKKYVEQNNDDTAKKIRRFMTQLDHYRKQSRQGALSELIWNIYRDTGYYDFVGGMPGGRQRQANLRALYDRARAYETTSFRGLFRFLRFIERMEEQGDDLGAARALSEQEDVVRMMTIHKSKGLEFPVVIVGAMASEFNFQDLKKRYLLDKDLGFASNYINPIKRITYSTLYKQAVKQKKLREQLAEEMRVLYVALTRAKEKLVMVGNVNSFVKKQEAWEQMLAHPTWVLPAYYRSQSKTYLDWVAPALIRHEQSSVLRKGEIGPNVSKEIRQDQSNWDIQVIHGSDLTDFETDKNVSEQKIKDHLVNWKPVKTTDRITFEKVDARLNFQYTHRLAKLSRAKQSVTEIKRQQEQPDEYSDNQFVIPYQAPITKRPVFMQREKTVSAAEKGTIMHTVMQHLPFAKALAQNEINEFIHSLVDREILRSEMVEVIDTQAIEKFYTTDIAKYMMTVEKIYREVPFSLTLPAQDVYRNWDESEQEEVLIQGVIDCLIPTDEGWIILDYKTDRINGDVTDNIKDQLIKRYQIQMNLYRQAIEKIWQQPVKSVYLYFFSKELLLNVPKR